MPIAKATTFQPAPEGTHIARCFACISLGTQHSEMFADAFKVLLMFELPNEMIETEDGAKPAVVSKEYTLSLSKKSNLSKHLNSWRGRAFTPEELKGFEVSNVVGAPCQVAIAHKQTANGGTWADIEAITGLPKGMTCPKQWHPSIKYEIEHGENDVFRSLPEWIQKKIRNCEEWTRKAVKSIPASEPPAESSEDDIPF